LKKLGSDDVKIIINTHWHSDHTDGNKVFGKAYCLMIKSYPTLIIASIEILLSDFLVSA